MATLNHSVDLAHFHHIVDPAHAAKVRAETFIEDDDVYGQAMADVEELPATSVFGIRAKFEALSLYLDMARAGDELGEEGWASVDKLVDGIQSALATIAGKSAH